MGPVIEGAIDLGASIALGAMQYAGVPLFACWSRLGTRSGVIFARLGIGNREAAPFVKKAEKWLPSIQNDSGLPPRTLRAAVRQADLW